MQEKLGFTYQWTTEDAPVPQMGETRTGHVNLLTRKAWAEKIVPCVPSRDDLWFRQAMMADPETMSYNHAWGGTIPFPEDKWNDWYDYWITNHENKRYYRYLKNPANRYVGEIAYHYDDDRCIFVADVIVPAAQRGIGYGGRGLELLCEAAQKNGVTLLYDDIAIDNPATPLFRKHGFVEEYRTDEIIMLKKDLQEAES